MDLFLGMGLPGGREDGTAAWVIFEAGGRLMEHRSKFMSNRLFLLLCNILFCIQREKMA
ncbi:hypothetical protein HNQ50_001181 [Silvimonas terrae]|uniref:Uncharacterized protein n=1 Tax=Silvimonas terrae TaxID=300266 RepID=A0A840RAM7_9NEIS|nr:hypothetical protein [Silvimonas terrae]MBB5190459.1 hypothetical protein [Silvimonas terrae]